MDDRGSEGVDDRVVRVMVAQAAWTTGAVRVWVTGPVKAWMMGQ